MRKFAGLLIALLLVSACSQDSEMTTKRTVYTKDHRTGLCFANRGSGTRLVVTHVPCSPEVLALVH